MGENVAAGLAFSNAHTCTRLILSLPHIKSASQPQLHIHKRMSALVM